MNSLSPATSLNNSSTTSASAAGVTLRDLQKQYPHLKMSAQTFSGESAIREYASKQSGKYNVAIDPRAISRMDEDGEFALKIHDILAGVKEYDDKLESYVRSSGAELVKSGTIIDKDGNVGYWGMTRTGGGEGMLTTSKKSREDMMQKMKERHKAEAEQAEKLKAAKQKKEEQTESLEINLSIEAEESILKPTAPGLLDIEA